MSKAVVLGGGMVGSVIAADLAADAELEVVLVDVSEENLARAEKRAPGLRLERTDLAAPGAVAKVVEGADVVVGALASHLGLETLRAVVESGTSYCDISFMPEDALALDDLARERGVSAIIDCGVAPGLSHMMAAYGSAWLDRPESVVIYVGGLPRERRWPFEYKAGFAPADVVEEYTRPARLVEHGHVVVREALSEPELIDLPGVGTLEAFNTDGLRSLVSTLEVPHMKEKTLRYPGHIELMRVFRASGLFSKEPVQVGEVSVRPLDVFSTLVFPAWTYDDGEEDLTVMRVTVAGERDGARCERTWDLLDFFDRKTGATSMSRTTGFPAAIVARALARGRIAEPGVLPPERVALLPGVFDEMLAELSARGVEVRDEVVCP